MLQRHLNTDLVEFSRTHLHYDLQMFFEIAPVQLRLTQNGDFLKNLPCIDQGLKEAVALHLRNLTLFFYNDSPIPSEFTAADYCAEEKWLEVCHAMTRSLRIAQKRAEKMLLPLSLERNSLEGPDKAWDLEVLMAEIKLVLDLFLKTAKSECLAPAFVQGAWTISYLGTPFNQGASQRAPLSSQKSPQEAAPKFGAIPDTKPFILNPVETKSAILRTA